METCADCAGTGTTVIAVIALILVIIIFILALVFFFFPSSSTLLDVRGVNFNIVQGKISGTGTTGTTGSAGITESMSTGANNLYISLILNGDITLNLTSSS